ncbi:MAG: siderophore-interacting protein [Amphritea sp.]
MAPPTSRVLSVLSKQQLTPNMIRITLGGPNLKGFPEGYESGYIKLKFSIESLSDPMLSSLQGLLNGKDSCLRTYTVRSFNAKNQQLTIDFVAHGTNGPASAWAMHAMPGDNITITGPGDKKLVDMNADWFFIAGDMTALPAISVNLEQMPRDARGYAVIAIINEADKQQINAPEGVTIHWVVNPDPTELDSQLLDTVKKLEWLEGYPSVWVACEFSSMRQIRTYFRKERGLNRDQVYASSYWKIGDTDEGNKAAKRNDTDAG